MFSKSDTDSNLFTIIIPTYSNTNGLKSILSYLINRNFQIIIIDNQPTEEKKKSIALSIKNNNAQISYLPQEKNIGFAKAINIGAKQSKTEWLVLLNDDVTIPDQNIFDAMIAFAVKHHLSAVSPVLKNSKGEVENLGYRILPIGRAVLNFKKFPFINEKVIDGLTAACLLIRKKDFDEVGGLDERFFAYLEDVDLFLRIKKSGKTFAVCQDIAVVHDQGTSSSKMGNFKQKQDLKNWIRIIIKNWETKTIIRYFPFIVIERLKNVAGVYKNRHHSL
jgi:GT2 family glycosyltransferase